MSSGDDTVKQIEIRHDSEMRLDIDTLEKSVNLQNVRDWMLSRFQRDDELVPIDNDHLEVPHDIFVNLWHRSVDKSNLREYLGQASAELARDAWTTKSPDWAAELLRFLAIVRPKEALPVLFPIVQGVTSFDPSLIERGLDLKWLEAAASYSESRLLLDDWKRFIKNPRYAQVAYQGLRHDIEFGVRYLPELYERLPENSREFLIYRAVIHLFEQSAVQVRELLNTAVKENEIRGDCLRAIQATLKKLGRARLKESHASDTSKTQRIFEKEVADSSCRAVYTLSTFHMVEDLRE